MPSHQKSRSRVNYKYRWALWVFYFYFSRTSAPDIADFASAESAEETGLRSEPPVAETYTFHCVSGVN